MKKTKMYFNKIVMGIFYAKIFYACFFGNMSDFDIYPQYSTDISKFITPSNMNGIWNVHKNFILQQ